MGTCSYERDGNQITLFLGNSLQESQQHKLVPPLLRHLRDQLQNDYIEIKTSIRANTEEDGKKRMYTDEDKLKYLEEEYPALAELREKLGLILG